MYVIKNDLDPYEEKLQILYRFSCQKAQLRDRIRSGQKVPDPDAQDFLSVHPGAGQDVRCVVTSPLPGGTIVWSMDDDPLPNNNR